MTASGANDALLYLGQRLKSSLCSTHVVVLDPGSATEVPLCGGAQMKPGALIPCSEPDRPVSGSVRTERGSVYSDETTGLKLRCTRSGSGMLSVHGREMFVLPPAPTRRPLERADVLG
jgi:hypothetical protein